jgi:cytochrome c peroxidase
VLTLATADGTPLQDAQIEVGGGMPGHGHGFPTKPRAERFLGNGEFLVEGLQFNMRGRWQITVALVGAAGVDRATLPFDLEDPAGGAAAPLAPDLALLRSLSLASLGPVPTDPSNRVSGNAAAADLGERLFFDPGLSANGKVSCGTCHRPAMFFTDGKRLAAGIDEGGRNAPSLLGVGYGQWFTWDGRRDSMWSHALTPLEHPKEMGTTRLEVARYMLGHAEHGPAYAAIFGEPPASLRAPDLPKRAGPYGGPEAKRAWETLPRPVQRVVDTAFANVGKVLEAYQRRLPLKPSRFDRYVAAKVAGDAAADSLLTADERAGLALFVDDSRTQCLRCHNGPLFTNFGFHNISTGSTEHPHYDLGRSIGLQAAVVDPFNCRGPFSDAPEVGGRRDCPALDFADTQHAGGVLRGAFKVPSLRNVAATGPYMHDGRFPTLEAVLAHYREPPDNGRHELAKLALDAAETGQLVAFLKTLTSER